jgi:hypothetical protein
MTRKIFIIIMEKFIFFETSFERSIIASTKVESISLYDKLIHPSSPAQHAGRALTEIIQAPDILLRLSFVIVCVHR